MQVKSDVDTLCLWGSLRLRLFLADGGLLSTIATEWTSDELEKPNDGFNRKDNLRGVDSDHSYASTTGTRRRVEHHDLVAVAVSCGDDLAELCIPGPCVAHRERLQDKLGLHSAVGQDLGSEGAVVQGQSCDPVLPERLLCRCEFIIQMQLHDV